MKFILEIEMGNVGMCLPVQVATAMREHADRVEASLHPEASGPIYDENGNRVGTWEFTEREEG